MSTSIEVLPATSDRVVGDVTTVTIGEGRRQADGSIVETPRTIEVRLVRVSTVGANRWATGLSLDGTRHYPVYLGAAA